VQVDDEKVVVVLNYGEPTRLEMPRRFADEGSGTPNNRLCEPLCGVYIAYRNGAIMVAFNM
jgi:hypothetical protein